MGWKRAAIALIGILLLTGAGVAVLRSATPVLTRDSVGPPAAIHAEDIPAGARAFLSENCAGCHNADEKSGLLDLTSLKYDPEDRTGFATWVRVHDRVKAGEMPPKDEPRPDGAATATFVKSMATTLRASEQAMMAGEGRAVQRRMNRYEYENALRDLLGLPMAQIKDKLPLDGEAYLFNKSGEALDVSYVQMQRFMSAADYALRQAMSEKLNRPEKTKRRIYARDLGGLTGSFLPRENGTLPDRLAFPVLDGKAQRDVRLGIAPISNAASRDREAVGKVSSIFSDAGGYSWSFRAR